MSQEFFDRFASLSVFSTNTNKNGDGSLRLDEVNPMGQSFPSRLPNGSPGFRIKFTINKIIEVTPNPTSIYIYNLGPKSRALFETKNNLVILSAGYGTSAKVIFRGNVSRGRTTKQGADYVTHIEAADGLFAIQNSRIDQSFSAGVRKNQVITTLAGALQNSGTVTVGSITGVPNDGYNNGFVLSGDAADQLAEICRSNSLQFSIQDGKLFILPIGSDKGTPVITLSSNTGMIGIPERRDVGISVKALLNPDIGVFQKIAVSSKFVNGVYTTVRVVLEGDTWEGPWYTQMEAA